jgi:hypothetical protein
MTISDAPVPFFLLLRRLLSALLLSRINTGFTFAFSGRAMRHVLPPFSCAIDDRVPQFREHTLRKSNTIPKASSILLRCSR